MRRSIRGFIIPPPHPPPQLRIGCVAWPDQRRRGCDTLRAVPPFRHSPPRESKKKEQKNKIKQGKKERKKLLSARYRELWEWGAPSSIFIGDGLRWKERLELLVVYNCQKDCKRIKSLHIVIYHINCGVMQGFPALRKAVTTQVKRYRICSRVLI